MKSGEVIANENIHPYANRYSETLGSQGYVAFQLTIEEFEAIEGLIQALRKTPRCEITDFEEWAPPAIREAGGVSAKVLAVFSFLYSVWFRGIHISARSVDIHKVLTIEFKKKFTRKDGLNARCSFD